MDVTSILQEFAVPTSKLQDLVSHFLSQAQQGLSEWTDRGIPMIPSYVTKIPTGQETGTYLAADLGGSNFRVCSVKLLGNHKFEIVQSKWPVAHELQVGSSTQFFSFLADRVKEFMCTHHREHFASEDNELRMGFTFSFPFKQSSINQGQLLRWTKGFDIKDAVGKDVAGMLQEALDSLNLKIHIAAIVNDTVGSLMARSYTNDQSSKTVIGCIFGTGTNGAYVDEISNVKKYTGDKQGGSMAINTEWGSFDNDLKHLPNTSYDKAVDALTANPGYHMFEKRISGMFLGELLRQVLYDLHLKGQLFPDLKDSTKLSTPWIIDTSVPSNMELDDTKDYRNVGLLLLESFDAESTREERKAVLEICRAISTRAAHLSGAVIVGVLKHTKVLEKTETVDIGGDGSVFEHYPNFVDRMRDAIRILIGDDEKRLTFGLAKDGSGVGAALCALEEGE